MAFASLTIDLNARLARFETDLGKVAHIAERNAQRMERAFSRVGGALAGLGSVASLGGAIAAFKDLVDAAAKLDDLSEKTGASVEALSRLEQVVRIGGHQMEVAETTLIRLSKALHANDDEAKGAGKALAALGLNAEELRRKDPADALRIVAERLNQYGDGAGKTALALDLLGKSGAQALPFLKDLANEQGISTRITAEQAAKAEELQKSFARLANETRNFGQALALDAVPGLLKLAQAANEANRVKLDVFERLRFSLTFEGVADRIRDISAELDKAVEHRKKFLNTTGVLPGSSDADIEQLKRRLEFYRTLQRQEALALSGTDTAGERQRFGLEGAAKPLLNYQRTVEETGRKLQESAGRFEDYETRMRQAVANAIQGSDVIKARELAKQIEVLDSLFFDSRLEAEVYEGAMRKLTGTVESYGDTTKAGAQAARELQQIMDEGQRVFEETRTPIERLGTTIDRFGQLLAANAIDLDTYSRAVQRAHDDFDKLSTKGEKTAGELGEFMKQAARSMQGAMSDGFFDIMQAKFDDMGTRFKATIDRMVADVLAAQLGKKLFGDFDKTGEVGGWLGGLVKFLVPSTPSPFSGFTASAGASAAVGMPYVPREMLVKVHPGERIMTAVQNKGAMSGTYHISVNVYGVQDVNGFRASESQIAGRLMSAVRRAQRIG
ncbi:MAG TPA: hypothetical protein VJ797_15475 [Burkholderiales bacterium]|nr:hypothetical protein [Burkholderiales bacterium]